VSHCTLSLAVFLSLCPSPAPQVCVYLRNKSCLIPDCFLFDADSMARRSAAALACQTVTWRRYTNPCPCTVQKRAKFLRPSLKASGDGSKPGPLKKSHLNTEVCHCFRG